MKFEVEFPELTQRIDAEFHEQDLEIQADMGVVHVVKEYVGGNPYTGDYAVTPKVAQQTMPTKGKFMTDDVTVKAIPIYETSNASGGSTIYIAKEI